MLRAIRFFSVYGFAIDPRTSKSVQAFAPMLKKVSPERIQKELMAALKGENFSFFLPPLPRRLLLYSPRADDMHRVQPKQPLAHI